MNPIGLFLVLGLDAAGADFGPFAADLLRLEVDAEFPAGCDIGMAA